MFRAATFACAAVIAAMSAGAASADQVKPDPVAVPGNVIAVRHLERQYFGDGTPGDFCDNRGICEGWDGRASQIRPGPYERYEWRSSRYRNTPAVRRIYPSSGPDTFNYLGHGGAYERPPGARMPWPKAHRLWCAQRYKSYRRTDNTFQPQRGPRKSCNSPFD